MNPFIRFSLLVEAIDCYLYCGYLFIVMNDGRLLNVSYHFLVNQLKARYPEYSSLIELVFLHNEYAKSDAAKIILGVSEINDAFKNVWKRAADEISFELYFEDISDECNIIDEYSSMPLDMRAYGGRLFVGCRHGLYESKLNLDGSFRIQPSKLSKCFDGKVIGLNSRNGIVVVSADWDGLLTGELFDFATDFKLDERKPIEKRSLRTGWMSSDIINYDGSSSFAYIYNECSDRVSNVDNKFYSTTQIREKKVISQFAKAVYGMDELFSKTKIKQSDILYSFNSSEKGFFVKTDGNIVNATIREGKVDDEYYISSRVQPFSDKLHIKEKPLSSCIVSKGCVLEFFDKVELVQNHKTCILCDHPVNSMRSYLNSNNYRDILTIVDDDSITFNAIYSWDLIKNTPAFPKPKNVLLNTVPIGENNDNTELPF